MALYASWIHGNALTVESPVSLSHVGHFGWGADLQFVPGKASWLHIPLHTPVIVGDRRAQVQKLFLMFKSENCEIRYVHIYDGSATVQELNDFHLSGDHRSALDRQNTFNLSSPHTVLWGMGISFFVQANIGFDTTIRTKFILASAGGDFIV